MVLKKRLCFKKFYWEITEVKKINGNIWYKYRLYRRYFKNLVALSYTTQSYDISKNRWDYLKKKLKENKNFHYNQELWSGYKR